MLLTVPCLVGQLTLTWEDNSDNEQGFKIERCSYVSPATSCSNFTQVAAVTATAATVEGYVNARKWVNTNLTVGNNYCYQVRAYNASGNSLYTNTACATVGPVVVPQDSTNLSVN